MNFETLDERRMFAAGLDPSFGIDGTAAAPTGHSFGTVLLATDSSIYVETTPTGNGHHVVRYSAAGQLDASWGGPDGVAVPFDAVRFAYDKRSGSLFVGGFSDAVSEDARSTVWVAKLLADGTPDATFGTNGTMSFTAGNGVAREIGESRTIVLRELLPLAHGGLMMAIEVATDRTTSGSDIEGLYVSSVGRTDATLIRLNANGRRDVQFGRRGAVVVASGYSASSFTPFDEVSSLRQTATLGDVEPNPDGTFRVVTSLERFGNFSGVESEGTVDVVSHVVGSSGTISPAQSRWRLFDRSTARDPAESSFSIGRIFARGNRTVAIASSDRLATSAFQLRDGKRPTLVTVPAPAGFGSSTQLIAGPSGYFVFSSAHISGETSTLVTRLRDDFTVDRRWGIGTLDVSEFPLGEENFASDPNRILLAYNNDVMQRYRAVEV